jgi:hypothetical protein
MTEQTRLQIAEAALNAIAFPIRTFQDQAKAEGRQIDGVMAMHLSKDPGFLKGIAQDALAKMACVTVGEQALPKQEE